MTTIVCGIRRYPVKSMGGQSLESVVVDGRGLVGDRWYAVVDADGRFASGKDSRRFRRRDAVFDYDARRSDSGEVTVSRGDSSWTVGDPALDAELSEAMRAPVQVLPEGDTPHQDAAHVSLVGTASLRWCADRWGGAPDARRTRSNLLLETDEPFVEESWVGREVVVGSTRLRILEPAPRCRMLDIEQDGIRPAGPWLKQLGTERDLNLAVYAEVGEPRPGGLDDVLGVVGCPVGVRNQPAPHWRFEDALCRSASLQAI
jgi:uncharacterized protein YcbX